MTKADIVSEIAKNTGVEKGAGAGHRRGLHGEREGFAHPEQQRVFARLRQFRGEETREEGGPQHLEEHHHYHSRTQHSGIQARQELCREGEINWS